MGSRWCYSGGVKLRIVRGFIFWLLVLCMPLLFLTSALRWAVSEIKLYEYGFNKYEIELSTGISSPELKSIAMQLIDYFNSRTDSAQVVVGMGERKAVLFSEKELIHLRDVRDLVRLNNMVQMSTLITVVICILVLVLLSRQRRLILVKAVLLGSGLTLGLMITLALWCWLGFDQLFYLFHVASFRNDYWMLNPAEDYLIRLFPEGFFYDAALFVFGAVIIVSLLLVAGSLYVLRLWGGGAESCATIWPW